MDMTGERRIPAPRQTVWNALNDPAVLRDSIPGCQSLEKESDTAMKATAAVKIGPISARFTGNVLLSDIDPPSSYTISGEGQGGVAGFAKGGAKVNLADDGADTLLRYEVHAQVGGKLAQLGARLVDASAKQMAEQFFDRFSARVAPPAPEAAAAPAAASAGPAASAAPPASAATALSAAAPGEPNFPAVPPTEPAHVSANHQRVFPSAPGSAVSEPVLPPPNPPSAVSVFSMIPREPYGLPVVAWIGIAVYLVILLLYVGSII
ncbi:MAG TPA: carbon monoxide dehydrogenase subunit G [Acetobacteraceae bacterium]|nr:carbon monoxide dehydrogenase subunit G [Acetobacteraceae bacterium]